MKDFSNKIILILMVASIVKIVAFGVQKLPYSLYSHSGR
jgi:hypothetical protein